MIQRELPTQALKFITYKKMNDKSESDFLTSIYEFEEFLKEEKEVSFHGLFINSDGTFAQLLGATSRKEIKKIVQKVESDNRASSLFSCVDERTIQQWYHELLLPQFMIPRHFGSFEHGVMRSKSETDYSMETILALDKKLQTNYLQGFDNTKGHALTQTEDKFYGEITFGDNLVSSREICFGYFQNKDASEFLNAFDLSTATFGFWCLLG